MEDSLYHSFVDEFEQKVSTKADFAYLLRAYFAALKIGHASVFLNDYTAYYLPLYIEGRIFISNPNEYLKQYGFEDKDEILSVNGVNSHDRIVENEKYTSASTDKCRELMTARNVFRSFSLEGVGITPHYEVHQTVSDFYKDKDTVLEATIQMI